MRAPARMAGLVLIALALAFAAGSLKLPIRQDGIPGAGLVPLVASLLLLPLALPLVLSRRRGEPDETFHRAPVLALVALVAYALVIGRLGFVLSTFALVVVWVAGFHARRLPMAVALSVALTAGAVILFHTLLRVQIPLFPTFR